MPLPRALWVKAPFALLAHPVGFLAVITAALLVAMGAAAAPLMNAGAESEALQNKIQQLTPLGAGLVIEHDVAPLNGDRKRRANAIALGRSLPSVGAPVLTTTTYAQLTGRLFAAGNPLEVVAMARTNATRHVERLAGDGRGVWVSSATARVAHLKPGGRLMLAAPGGRPLSFRIGAIYRQLDTDLGNSYWVNFAVRIRARNPDSPLPPPFVLVDQQQLYRIARTAGHGLVGNTFEFPIDPGGMTPQRARNVARSFQDARSSLGSKHVGCGRCHVTSSLVDAVRLASASNAALRPIVSLLAGFCVLVALAAAVVAGGFTTRRRAGEARLSLVLGERSSVFGLRAVLEALVPAIAGAAIGLPGAIELARLLAPNGTVDSSVFVQTALLALASVAAAAAAVSAGAVLARGRLSERTHRVRVPWELPIAAAAAAAWIAVASGGGLVRNGAAGSHPRLAVLVLPALVAAVLAGVGARAARALLRRRTAADAPTPVYLAVRRLASARGLLVVLTVTVAVGVASVAFAQVLRASLDAGSTTKALVANGSDVQGIVDYGRSVPASFPYAVTKVTEAFSAGQFASGRQFELIAVEPASLERVLAAHWPASVRDAVRKLIESKAPLPAIAIGTSRGTQLVSFGSDRRQVDVVATPSLFPGEVAGTGLLVVPLRALGSLTAGAYSYVWASGPPLEVERALARSELTPSYMTQATTLSRSADVTTITRTYGLLRVVALAFGLIALVALMLYLHARARSQLVTSEFLRRMGLADRAQAASVALEATLLVAFATVVGLVAAVAVSSAIVDRVDPLPQYAPSASTVVPWWLLLGTGAAVIAIAAVLGAAAVLLANREDVGEALRVA